MLHFLIIAGIPAEVYDDVISVGDKRLTGGDGEVISRPLTPLSSGQYRYKQRYVNELIAKLKDGVASALAGASNKKLYMMFVYINYGDSSTALLLRRFIAFALPRSLNPLELDNLTNRQKREQKNKLVKTIGVSAIRMRRNLKVLEDELSSGANRTPLLLPCRNFQSKHFNALLDGVGHELSSSGDPEGVIKKARTRFERWHPRVTLGRDQRRHFMDDGRLLFKAPGKERHGWHQETEGHQPECLFGSRARLGAPYDPKFHYDCEYENCLVSGVFPNCHDFATNVSRCSHVNIAPNDYIRS